MYDQEKAGREEQGEDGKVRQGPAEPLAEERQLQPSDDECQDAQEPDQDDNADMFGDVMRRYIKEAHLTQASQIEPLPLEWLWEKRIPLGQFTLLAGDPGVGKSLVALDLAARVSTGACWPDELGPDELGPEEPGRDERATAQPTPAAATPPPYEPANVLILAAHENRYTTLRPRLERAGADLERIFFADGVSLAHPSRWVDRRPLRMPDDFMSLVRVFMELGPFQLMILDPAWAFCHRGRESSRVAGPAQLQDLCKLAVKFSLAIVGVTDLARASRGQLAYRAAGAKALTAAAQAAWGIVRHPRDGDRRVLLPLKMNMAKPAPGLEFQIDDEGIQWNAAPAQITAEALLAAERAGSDQAGAEKWLKVFLAHGPRPSKEVVAQGMECGISTGTLRRAKYALGVRSQLLYDEAGTGHWNWTLADEPAEVPAGETVPAGDMQIARISAAG
jgi:hypothetical protein